MTSNLINQSLNFPLDFTLESGEIISIRLLESTDSQSLNDYFFNLSENTRRRFGPHPLTEEEAFKICQNLDNQHLRFVAILKSKPQIIAYFLVFLGVLPDDQKRYEVLNIELNNQKDCTLAPSVADDFQAKKLGSLLMPVILKSCKVIDYQRLILWGGVQASNERAVHFYQKFGFKQVGEFQNQNGNNFDMVLAL